MYFEAEKRTMTKQNISHTLKPILRYQPIDIRKSGFQIPVVS